MDFRRTGDKVRFSFLDERCIGRRCWQPGMYQHRSPLSCGGSRNTGSPDTPCCMQRAYRGCPEGPDGEHQREDELYGLVTVTGVPAFQKELAMARAKEGWKKV